MRQLIISVGRQFGSGGHEIAQILAGKFGLELYDSNILEQVAVGDETNRAELHKFDEKPASMFFSQTIHGYTNSKEENVANMQFSFLRKKAADGESFVVVGRCAETVLRGTDGLISIFVLGDPDVKADRIAQMYHLSPEEAQKLIRRTDWARKSYHNYYCKDKWGDSRSYDLTINSSRLGIRQTADFLAAYIQARLKV